MLIKGLVMYNGDGVFQVLAAARPVMHCVQRSPKELGKKFVYDTSNWVDPTVFNFYEGWFHHLSWNKGDVEGDIGGHKKRRCM